MSTGENVWPQIEQLATALDGSRESSEHKLDQLQQELRATARHVRDEIRRQMIQIVAALSRLEVRMIDADGPLQAAI
jgi:hypothetical protein